MPPVLDRNIEEITCEAYNEDPTRVRRVARAMPPDESFEAVSVLLKAIADPTRARILYALSIEPLCVCELSTLLQMSMPAVSHHLKILSMSGVIKPRKEGKFACYHITRAPLAKTLSTLLSQERQPV